VWGYQFVKSQSLPLVAQCTCKHSSPDKSCSTICDQFWPLILFRSEEEPRLLIFTGDQTKLSGNLRPSTCCVPLLFPNPLSRMSNLCTAFALIFHVPPLSMLYGGLQKKPLRPWRWSHLISLAQHIMQQCDLRHGINIQDSLKYLVAWRGNMPPPLPWRYSHEYKD